MSEIDDDGLSDNQRAVLEAFTSELGVNLFANSPFVFEIGLQGDLLISWQMNQGGGPGAQRMCISVPAEELPRLREKLDDTQTIRGMLAVKKPERGAH